MSNPSINEFGERLVREVRDAAIRSCDRFLAGGSNAAVAKRWEEVLKGDARNAISVAIPDCIDEALGYLLTAIDQELLKLSYSDKYGRTVSLSDDGDGELAGWYMGGDGWRDRYSQERFFDDFKDVT